MKKAVIFSLVFAGVMFASRTIGHDMHGLMSLGGQSIPLSWIVGACLGLWAIK